jgi:hypothetical protein
MVATQPINFKDFQGRNMTSDEETQSVEQFKMDKEMHRLIRKFGGPEVYSIYAHLLDSSNKNHDWGCWPSYDSIMEDLGILNRPVIADALNWLFDAGLIEWGLESRKAWFIPLRKADSSVIELLRHIPSFRNRTKRDMYSSVIELSIVLLQNANVNQDNVEDKTLSTNVLNGPEGPTDSISAIDSDLEIETQLEEIETQPQAASVVTAPPPDRRGLKQRWREAYEAVQDDFKARSGVMAAIWTEITGREPDYKQLNKLAKDHNSMWAVCEGILKMANSEIVDDPLVYLRKVLANGTNTRGIDRGRSERPDRANGQNPAPANQHEPGFWETPDAKQRAEAAWHV